MKYFLILTISIMWSWLTLANPAFVGTWVWSAFQCRDSNVESDSARSVTWEVQDLNPSTAKIVVNSNNSASFSFCCDENNQPVRNTGTWGIVGDDQTRVQMGDAKGGFRGWLIDGDLVIDEDHQGNAIDPDKCNDGDRFVIVFGRVDE